MIVVKKTNPKLWYYFCVYSLYTIFSIVNAEYDLEHSNKIMSDNYFDISVIYILSELLISNVYVPEKLELFYIALSLTCWRLISQLSIFQYDINDPHNWSTYMLSGIIILSAIYAITIIIIFGNNRKKCVSIFAIQSLNIGLIVFLYFYQRSFIYIHHWQIFYFVAFYIQERKFKYLYCFAIGVMLDGIISYGAIMPIYSLHYNGYLLWQDQCFYGKQNLTWQTVVECSFCKADCYLEQI